MELDFNTKLSTFTKIVNTVSLDCERGAQFQPQIVMSGSFLNDVASDARATVMSGFAPFEVEMIPVPVFECWFTRWTRRIEGIFGQDGISAFQGFRIPFRIDCLDPKQIFMHLFKTFHMTLEFG